MKWNFRLLLVVIVTLGVTALLGISSQAWNTTPAAAKGGRYENRQDAPASKEGPIVRQAVGFGISPAVRDLPEAQGRGNAIAPELLSKLATLGDREKNPRNAEKLRETVPGAGAGYSPFVDEALAPAANFPAVIPTPGVSSCCWSRGRRSRCAPTAASPASGRRWRNVI